MTKHLVILFHLTTDDDDPWQVILPIIELMFV